MTLSGAAPKHAPPVARNARRDKLVISEMVLHTQLNDAAAAAAKDPARVRIGQATIAGVGDRSRRSAQVEVVERIEKIGANLYAMAFRDRNGFLDSDIPVPGTRAIDGIPLGVAPLPGLRRRKRGGIEPLYAPTDVVRCRLASVNLPSLHGVGAATPPPDNAGRHGEGDRERRAGTVGADAGDRPATGNPVENAIANIELAPTAHGEVVQVIEDQGLARNAVGIAVVRHFIVGILSAAGGRGIV